MWESIKIKTNIIKKLRKLILLMKNLKPCLSTYIMFQIPIRRNYEKTFQFCTFVRNEIFQKIKKE